MKSMFSEIKNDLPASIVVFFVALPLCLGIALASGAPLFAGIIAGTVGGIAVGSVSGSQLGVSGPAAGLTVIVFSAIASLGSWEAFLLSVVIAGILQLVMAHYKLGIIAYYFPTSVIKGMLTGIGLIIILKQVPHALGYNSSTQIDFFGGLVSIEKLLTSITPGAIAITIFSMLILILWDSVLIYKHLIFRILPGPLVVVGLGIVVRLLFQTGTLPFYLNDDQVVRIPVATNVVEFFGQFRLPDFGSLTNIEVYKTAFVIAIVASLETLLCVEATDKLDPKKRVTPANRELRAQGIGNILSGLIGGLPVTQVIVRSSANISFGAKTKMSSIFHGVLLLISAVTIPTILNMIPLASLASILIIVGYKLAKPEIFRIQYKLGVEQFIPFFVTVIAILFTDLLKGIGVGLIFAVFKILIRNYQNPYSFIKEDHGRGERIKIVLAENVTFLNKANILKTLSSIPENTKVEIDGSKSRFISYDVKEIIKDFIVGAIEKNIEVKVIGIHQLQES